MNRSFEAHTGAILCCEYIPANNLLVTSGSDLTLAMWDTSSSYAPRGRLVTDFPITALKYYPITNVLMCGTTAGHIHLWKVEESTITMVRAPMCTQQLLITWSFHSWREKEGCWTDTRISSHRLKYLISWTASCRLPLMGQFGCGTWQEDGHRKCSMDIQRECFLHRTTRVCVCYSQLASSMKCLSGTLSWDHLSIG